MSLDRGAILDALGRDLEHASATSIADGEVDDGRAVHRLEQLQSFVDRLLVSDTQVNGSWTHPNSVIFRDAQFLKTSISGDLSVDGSAFSLLWVLSSHIVGTLDLNETEARCGYHINSSTTGYVTADRAGFGNRLERDRIQKITLAPMSVTPLRFVE